MRTLWRVAPFGLWVFSAVAVAAPNDFQIYQLGNATDANIAPYANANFQAFAEEIGAAMNAVNLMPPGTLGHDGFSLNAEISVVTLHTSPVPNPTNSSDPAYKASPPAGTFYMPTVAPVPQFNATTPLLIPSIHVRKGLPFSFELGARAAYLNSSQMGFGTAEVRWAVNEGFAYLPDICIRGSVSELFNTRDFDLTTAGLDIGIGKRFAIGGMITLTPYGGWNLVFVGAGSNSVDFDPSRTYASTVLAADTQVRNSAGVFNEVSMGSNAHNRFYGGLRFIGGIIQLGAEISYSILGTVNYNTTAYQLPPVMALNGTLGLDF